MSADQIIAHYVVEHGVLYSITPVGTRWKCICGANERGDFVPHDLALLLGREHSLREAVAKLIESERS